MPDLKINKNSWTKRLKAPKIPSTFMVAGRSGCEATKINPTGSHLLGQKEDEDRGWSIIE